MYIVAHDFVITTSATDYNYNQAWLSVYNTDHFIFYVKACADPHIVLSDRMDSTENVYEVALGIAGKLQLLFYKKDLVWHFICLYTHYK